MNKYVLIIPCLMAMSGCQPEETKPPVVPAPLASAVPVPASAPGEGQTVDAAPVKEGSPVVAEKPLPVKKNAMPVAVEQKPVAAAAESALAAPAAMAPAPKAKLAAPVVAEAKPQAGVSESEALALAKKRNCFACHMLDKKVVGPAWKEVAAKYRGDAAAQVRLENKIAKGGSGAWGSMAMPAQPQVSGVERTLLVRFILNLK